MNSERNYGLELFRLLAMVMITILHFAGFRINVLAADNSPALFSISCFMKVFCYCGVNCFALLTGYLSGFTQYDYDEKWFFKVFQLWVKILLWGIPLYLGTVILNPQINFSAKIFISYFFVHGLGWWYIYAYFGLLMFLPILSGFSSRFSLRGQIFAGLSIFCIFGIFSRLPTHNSYYLAGGYSCFWLIICFMFGQIIRTWAPRFIQWKFSNYALAAGVVLGGGVHFVSEMLRYFLKVDYCNIFPISYLSPFILLEAVCLLILFSQIKIKNTAVQKIVKFLSLNSLGIYLFQCHAEMWKILFGPSAPKFSYVSELLWKLPLSLLGIIAIGVAGEYVINRICSSNFIAVAGKKTYHLSAKIVSSLLFEKKV